MTVTAAEGDLPKGTILAGHGTVKGARQLAWTHIAAVPSELLGSERERYLLADNRTGDLGSYNDEKLIELLRELSEQGLLEATGYDAGDLDEILESANRYIDVADANERSTDPASEWVGLPEFVPAAEPWRVVVSCESEEDRDRLLSTLGIETIHKYTRGTLSIWWPDRAREDLTAVRFEPEP